VVFVVIAFFLGQLARGNGVFDVLENANSSAGDDGGPFAVLFVPVNANATGGVASILTFVPKVLAFRYNAKVAESVVVANAVDVVYFAVRPFAANNRYRYAVFKVVHAAAPDTPIAHGVI